MAYHSTKGIVFNSIKYRDHDLIVRIYTQEYGLLSFMVNGARKSRSRYKAGYFQPLTLLDLEIAYKENRDLHRIKELHIQQAFATLHTDIAKSTIAVFIAEVLYKSIQEEEQNEMLFAYLYQSIVYLDILDKGVANFHSLFLLQLTQYLGIQPSFEREEKACFHMEEGSYRIPSFLHEGVLDEEESKVFHRASTLPLQEWQQLNLSKAQRKVLLANVLAYYKMHLPEIGELKSLEVLSAVFS